MLRLKKLTIGGFRGFALQQEMDFDNQVVLLVGPNHYGKSSVVNALEWCLFGDACAQKTATGISERATWEVANRYTDPLHVSVEAELAEDDGVYVVCRTKKTVRSKSHEKLRLTLPEGGEVSGDEATQRLTRLLRSNSIRDFMVTVHLHQEAIRDILTQDPKHRNDAIDRLLGLSYYKEFLLGVDGAECGEAQENFATEIERLEGELQAALAMRNNDVADARAGAAEGGVAENMIEAAAAMNLAKEARNLLVEFAKDANIQCPDLEPPALSEDLPSFRIALQNELNRMRSKLPEQQEQKRLYSRQTAITALVTTLQTANTALTTAKGKVKKLDEQHGSQEELSVNREKLVGDIRGLGEQCAQASEQGDLVRRAIGYMAGGAARETENTCPVCGNEEDGLLARLQQEWERKFSEQVGQMTEEINARKLQKKKLDEAVEQYETLGRNVNDAKENLREPLQQVALLLGKDLSETDDPALLLQAELNKVKRRLGRLKGALDRRDKRLDAVQEKLNKLECIVHVLHAEQKKKKVNEISESPEFQELEELRDRLAELVEDTEQVKRAIRAVLTEEARERIDAAKTAIDGYFGRIARHPAISRISVQVQENYRGQNAYSFHDQDNRLVTPILSQGDFNALALAIFLGLSGSVGRASTFGFVMLDDPSQSLATEHKEALVQVLDEIAGQRQVILATMDKETDEMLHSATLTKVKTTYRFTDWTPAGGPVFGRDD